MKKIRGKKYVIAASIILRVAKQSQQKIPKRKKKKESSKEGHTKLQTVPKVPLDGSTNSNADHFPHFQIK